MISIQSIYKCLYYTPNGNMNKTCMEEKRCCIFYEVTCPDYYEVTEEFKLQQMKRRFKNKIKKFYEEDK